MHGIPRASADTPRTDEAGLRLRQLADVLGCPVSDFFDARAASRPDLAGATELLTLWSAIADDAGRAKLLRCAREALDEHRDWPAAAG